MIVGHVEHTCRNLVPTAVFLHELSSLPEERRREILGSEHAYQGVFRDLIEKAQVDGLVRTDLDPRLAALSVLGSTNWVYRWFRPGGAFTPEQIGSELAEMSIRGIATAEGLAQRAAPRADEAHARIPTRAGRPQCARPWRYSGKRASIGPFCCCTARGEGGWLGQVTISDSSCVPSRT